MPGYKLIIENTKVILKSAANYIINLVGIKDLNTGTGNVTAGFIDWKLQHYSNTAANFTSINPILLVGQHGVETDALTTAPKFKIGDGVTTWTALPYATSGGGVQSVTGPQVDNTDPINPVIDTPTLQEVTDEGNVTTTRIKANGFDARDSSLNEVASMDETFFYVTKSDLSANLFEVDRVNDTVKILGVDVATVNDLFNLIYITTGDQTTISNAAINITGLQTPTLEINKRYIFEGIIMIGCNNTGGVKIQVTVPSLATLAINVEGAITTATTRSFTKIISSATLTASNFSAANSSNFYVKIAGEVQIGTTSGAVSFGFASGTNTQTSTVFQLGTYINYKKIN